MGETNKHDQHKNRMAANLVSSTPIRKRARIGSNTCPKCEEVYAKDSATVNCSICDLDFCLKCSKVPQQMAELLASDKTGGFKWTCNICNFTFPSLSGISSQIKSIEDTTNKRLVKLEDDMQAMKLNIGSQVKDELHELKPSLVNEIRTEIKKTLQEDVRKEVKEIEDQKSRTMNLILFNAPESDSENSTVRKSFDETVVKDLCGLINVPPPDIKVLFRLGNPNGRKGRPLKIIFNNKKHRKDILDNVSKLKNVPSSHRLRRVIIAKDLTNQQRQENKQKRKSKLRRTDIAEKMETKSNTSDHENYAEETILTQQSDQLLAPLFGRHRSTDAMNDQLGMTDMTLSNVGDETIIGGLNVDVGSNDGQRTENV